MIEYVVVREGSVYEEAEKIERMMSAKPPTLQMLALIGKRDLRFSFKKQFIKDSKIKEMASRLLKMAN